jgi:hypothetical protein
MEINVRKPAVAGAFYPADENELNKMLREFFDNAPVSDKRVPRAIIVPHAGYVYSGQVAALAYKLVKDYEKVVLLGPSHTVYLEDVVSDTHQFWETPLGLVSIVKNDFEKNEGAHANEHCLEVQVPFLQFVLKKFEILPLVVGEVDVKSVSEKVQKVLDDKTLLVVSSDLSHYHSYDMAEILDNETIENIKNLNENESIDACGEFPIRILIDIAKKKNWKPKVLGYKNSGDVTGEKFRVVGYTSIAFYA